MGICSECKKIEGVVYCTTNMWGEHQSYNGMPSQVKKMELPEGGESYCFIWHENGIVHRNDGPAKIGVNKKASFFFWYQNGVKHREDGPSVYNEGFDSDWYFQGKKESRILVDHFDHLPFDELNYPMVSQSVLHSDGKGNYLPSLVKYTLMRNVKSCEGYQMWEALEGEMTLTWVRLVLNK